MKGDWEATKAIIDEHEDIVVATLTSKSEIALHIAVTTKNQEYVRDLLGRMKSTNLTIKNEDGNTALCFAAASGVVEIAEMLIAMNEELPMIRGGGGMTPIHMAALFGHREMVICLYQEKYLTNLNNKEFKNLFHAMVSADIYDVALKMLENKSRREFIARPQNNYEETALHLMARKPSAVGHSKELNLFQKLANSIYEGFYHEAKMRTLAHQVVEELWSLVVQLPVKELSVFLESPSKLLFDAAESGNLEFLVILIRSYPDLIWKVDEKNRSLFHIALVNRHENIFDIIYELGAIKDLLAMYTEDESGDNMLHMVARLPPPSRLQVVSGAALQMQSEVRWFEAVKKIVPRSYIKAKNGHGDVADDIFTKEHEGLRKEGERWMKETATACMLVATLIATVVFASAFALPGGGDDAGFPKLHKKLWFDLFLLSDFISLISSVASIVLFLSILTCRYAEEDFRTALTTKLLLGLFTLFVSIISMVFAFTATMILIRSKEPIWNTILIGSLASAAALSFSRLHYRLWFDMLWSFLVKYHKRKSGLYSSQTKKEKKVA
uniref:Ankyrin repeat-containing protein n=1 Tax=Noccaea caerulescens TaxID=107243 RepID=A0A1J3FST8_NOCCA